MADTTQERLPFQGSELEKEDVEFNKGLKVNNERSRFAKKASGKSDFEERAAKMVEQQQLQRNERFQLISQFMDTMRKRVLPSNRGLVGDQFEQELRQKLIDLVIDINNDTTEKDDGMGSATAIGLLLRVVMMQRDQLNELEYRLSIMEKKASRPPTSEG
jgi:hypothetical protein